MAFDLAVLAHLDSASAAAWLVAAAPFLMALGVFAVWWAGVRRRGGAPSRILLAQTLERLGGGPAYAAGTIAAGTLALVVAVIGFYWDVAWHIDLGRDENVFTPAHVMILAGLGGIAASGAVGIALATLREVPTRLRVGRVRIPGSCATLVVLGTGAMAGFPLDDLWHHHYGIDVTMWGPTHLVMIVGASLTPMALWLVLGEAGIRPARRGVARIAHAMAAGATLTGLSALQGEFDFGVPQFQLMYQPVLIATAAGVALIAARIALGPWGAMYAVLRFLALRALLLLLIGPGIGLTAPRFPLYIGSALVVEAVARIAGTERRIRFAVLSGAGIATAGIAAESLVIGAWLPHPWTLSMLPDMMPLVFAAAVGGALLSLGLASAVTGAGPAPRAWSTAVGFAAVAAALLLPLPRDTGRVQAEISISRVGSDATVHVQLTPPDAAARARWFELLSWQGGGRMITPMRATGRGTFVSDSPVPVTGTWKTLLRLHRGSEMTAVPVYMPADPEIDAPETPAHNRTAWFRADTEYLLREAREGARWPSLVAYASLAMLVAVWLAALCAAASRGRSFLGRHTA